MKVIVKTSRCHKSWSADIIDEYNLNLLDCRFGVTKQEALTKLLQHLIEVRSCLEDAIRQIKDMQEGGEEK